MTGSAELPRGASGSSHGAAGSVPGVGQPRVPAEAGPRVPAEEPRGPAEAEPRELDEARVEELFLRVVELDAEERARELDAACRDGAERARVEELLAWDARVPERFLAGDEPARSAEPARGRIGPYRILERLGEGGMGTVYAAQQEFPQREVALKVLRAGRVSEDAIRRFRTEIDVLGRLQHTGIARIYDAGVTEASDGAGPREMPWFTMELVRGVPLVRWARERGLSVPERLELLARVCDAVHYAHQRGVIHRDLKPDNVLVTREESSDVHERGTRAGTSRRLVEIGQPKVLDFGIARVVDPELGTRTHHTLDGDLVGTLSSMSPEQVAGDGRLVDVRSDVYALGVMLYELLCGRPPLALGGLTVPEAVRRIAEEEPVVPGALDPALRGDLSTIATKALEKDPERRYQTAEALAADLRGFVRGEPIEARADSRLYLLRRSLRRHRVAVGVAAGFALLVGAFGVTSARQARESVALAASEAAARRLADQDFERALAAVDLMAELGMERLTGTPGADAARRELLEAALGFHRGLVEAHPDAPGLRRRVALSRYRSALIERDLGRRDRALAESATAIAELEALLAEGDADGSEVELDLVAALTLHGHLLNRRGDPEGAAASLERAAARAAARIAAGEPSDRAVALLAGAHKHLAIGHRARGRLDEALATLDAARGVLEEHCERAPTRLLRTTLVELLQQSCVLRLERDPDAEGVEVDLQRAVLLSAELAAEEPNEPQRQQDHAGLRTTWAEYLRRRGRPREAAEELDRAIAIGERLARDHPALEMPRQNLVDALTNRSAVRMISNELAGAEADLARASELLEDLAADYPQRDWRSKLAGLGNNRAAVLIMLDRQAEAIPALERTIEHGVAVLAEHPGRVDQRAFLRHARANLARCHADLGEHAQAAAIGELVDYVHDGYASAAEVTGMFYMWQTAVHAAEADATLDPPARAAAAERYLAHVTAYLEEALERGFSDLPAVLSAGEWRRLREHPPLADLLE